MKHFSMVKHLILIYRKVPKTERATIKSVKDVVISSTVALVGNHWPMQILSMKIRLVKTLVNIYKGTAKIFEAVL
jgi:hypothetical protein